MTELEQRLLAARLELVEAETKRLATPKKPESVWSNPIVLAIVGATATAIVGLLTNKSQLDASRQLERDKLESSLILKAIDTNEPSERLLALQFLVRVGLVSDPEKKISNLTPEQVPRIQERSENSLPTFAHTPIAYSQSLVDRIRLDPSVPYPSGTPPLQRGTRPVKAIILHYTFGPDNSNFLRKGFGNLKGPLSHWVVLSNGKIEFIAPENERVSHVGHADRDLSNANTIGIETSGKAAFTDPQQVENLVRLVLDVAERWQIPTDMILSHSEVALSAGRNTEMTQQATEIRKMIAEIRTARTASQKQN